jgi:phosphonopyruvate decarboxylase
LRKNRGEGHERDFYTVGSMGHASSLALGIALAKPKQEVLVVDGDGAALMHMGALAICGRSGTSLKHVLINNGAHESVGGMPTVALEIDLVAVARACNYRHAERVSEVSQLSSAVLALHAADGPAFLEVVVALGTRKDLGRPTSTPLDNKRAFMSYLAKL